MERMSVTDTYCRSECTECGHETCRCDDESRQYQDPHLVADLLCNLLNLLEQGEPEAVAAFEYAASGVADNCEVPHVTRVVPYREAGVLTRDAGLVLTLGDGTEFQLTVLRSR